MAFCRRSCFVKVNSDAIVPAAGILFQHVFIHRVLCIPFLCAIAIWRWVCSSCVSFWANVKTFSIQRWKCERASSRIYDILICLYRYCTEASMLLLIWEEVFDGGASKYTCCKKQPKNSDGGDEVERGKFHIIASARCLPPNKRFFLCLTRRIYKFKQPILFFRGHRSYSWFHSIFCTVVCCCSFPVFFIYIDGGRIIRNKTFINAATLTGGKTTDPASKINGKRNENALPSSNLAQRIFHGVEIVESTTRQRKCKIKANWTQTVMPFFPLFFCLFLLLLARHSSLRFEGLIYESNSEEIHFF